MGSMSQVREAIDTNVCSIDYVLVRVRSIRLRCPDTGDKSGQTS